MDKYKDTVISESQFGFEIFNPVVSRFPGGSRILEVGCGSGFLLEALAAAHPTLHFVGIDPYENGFESTDHSASVASNCVIYKGEVSQLLEESQSFDFVFSFNVLEHIPNWEKMIHHCRLLCRNELSNLHVFPNYCFPFEFHFNIPIIFDKKITHLFFADYIERFESRNSNKGLWASLNFLSANKVIKFFKSIDHDFVIESDINFSYLKRLLDDPLFRKRRPVIARVVQTFYPFFWLFIKVLVRIKCMPYISLRF